MASEHGVLKSPVSGAGSDGPWGGRLSFVTAGGAGTVQFATITDTSFTSRIVREDNHIILTPENTTARGLAVATTSALGTRVFTPLATMSNNSSIFVTYTNPNGIAATASFYFMIFGGGTIT